MITNILAPSFIKLLKVDIGDAKYSLLLDESTDISVCKTLGVAINYLSLSLSVMVSTFLSLVPLEEGDSNTIAKNLCQELSKFNLILANLVGIGTDNASVMEPLKIPRVCDTQWLSTESAVTRILQQWIELKLHFNIAATNEKCFKPVQMQYINKIFQTSTGDSSQLLSDIVFAINALKNKIIPADIDIDILKNYFQHLVTHDCYLGYAFETKLKECKENVTNDIDAEIRFKCGNFIVAITNELKQRLPDNFKILQQVDLFSVQKILCPVKVEIAHILEHFRLGGII